MSPIDPEVKNKLQEIDCDLREHNTRLIDLEKQFTRQDQKLTNVENGVTEIKNTILTTNTTVIGLISQLIITKKNNESQEKISKFDNLTKIFLQVLAFGGTVLASIYFGSKLIIG